MYYSSSFPLIPSIFRGGAWEGDGGRRRGVEQCMEDGEEEEEVVGGRRAERVRRRNKEACEVD